MEGEKLELVASTMKFVAKQLTVVDRLGIISYDDFVVVNLPLTSMNEPGKQIAESAINGIRSGGYTNLCGGLIAGIEEMRKRTIKNEVASVLLFTDGLANVGYQRARDIIRATVDPDFASKSETSDSYSQTLPVQQSNYFIQPNLPHHGYPVQQMQQQMPLQFQQMPLQFQQYPIQQMVQQYPVQQEFSQEISQEICPIQQQVEELKYEDKEEPEDTKSESYTKVPLPCTINCFGFGADHDPNMLKDIAQHGSGMYYFIENSSNIPEAFADCLGGLLSVCAQNITLRVEAAENVKINKITTKFPLKTVEDRKVFEVQIGDLQSEEQRDILGTVELDECTETNSFQLCKVTVNYFNVISNSNESVSTTGAVARLAVVPKDQKVHYELDKQRNRILSAEAMEKATKAGNSRDLEKGRAILSEAIEFIQKSASANDEFCKGLVVDLRKCLDGLKSIDTYQHQGNQMLMNNYNAHYMQRSSNVQAASQQVYQTSARSHMQAKFIPLQKK